MTIYKHINRRNEQKPKSKRSWCDCCDSELVGNWEKCQVCGQRSGTKKFKKLAPEVDEWS